MSDDELDRHLNKILLAKGYNVATSCLRLAIDEAVRAERERCTELLKMAVQEERDRCLAYIKYRWTFDSNQTHTHNWHAMADTVRDISAGASCPKMIEPKTKKRINT